MCRRLTVELQRGVPHGPAGRAEQGERQHGYSRSKLQHSHSQTGATHQGLQSVNRTHLEWKYDDHMVTPVTHTITHALLLVALSTNLRQVQRLVPSLGQRGFSRFQ